MVAAIFSKISFMPRKLALRQDVHPFWYKQDRLAAKRLQEMG